MQLARLLLLVVLLIASNELELADARELHVEAMYNHMQVSPLQETPTPPGTDFFDADSSVWSRSVHDGKNVSSLTLTMVHRDSPFFPFKGSSLTSEQDALRGQLERDVVRVRELYQRVSMATKVAKQNFKLEQESTHTVVSRSVEKPSISEEAIFGGGFTSPLMSGLKLGSGEYFIRLGVGTPARDTFMVADTGSDLMWLQCAPCEDCYTQIDPIFDPALSSSFQRLPCLSPLCSMLELHSCTRDANGCLYEVAYGDGSFTSGEFSLETLTFSGASMPNVAIGCGHDNEGLFAGAAGLFGLGGGSLSFPSQMGLQFSKIFSYCLVPRVNQQSFSTLVFGNAGVPGNTIFTPLFRNPSLATFYYVSLTGISIGGNLLSIPGSAFKIDTNGDGGVIIDSGTSVTRLVEVAYGPLRSAFREAAQDLPFWGGVSIFDTCYDLSESESVNVPTVVLHFLGGADVALPPSNYFVPVDSRGTYCLAFASTPGVLSIIGNIQQQGFRVVFDGISSRLGFAANQC